MTDADSLGQEFKRKALDISVNEIYKHTIPLLGVWYNKKGVGRYGSLGTGIFVKKKGQYFILTAAHVVNKRNRIFVQTVTQSGIIELEKFQISFTLDNFVDVAVIVISRPIGDLLSYHYEALPFSKMMFGHQGIEATHYSIVGYPAGYIKVRNGTISYTCASYLVRSANIKIYNYNKFPISDFYVLQMHGAQVDVDGTRVKIKDPHGISGCGLWFITYKIFYGEMRLYYHLVGIMIEQRKAKFNVMIASNIKFVMYPIDKFLGEPSP